MHKLMNDNVVENQEMKENRKDRKNQRIGRIREMRNRNSETVFTSQVTHNRLKT